MNTVEDLMNHEIDRYTAEKMLADYKSRVGTMNGVYEIIDINYDFNERGKDVIFRCSGCGKIIHRMMIKGRNKWSELIKTCKDCEERKQKDDFEKSEKRKKRKFSRKSEKFMETILLQESKKENQIRFWLNALYVDMR